VGNYLWERVLQGATRIYTFILKEKRLEDISVTCKEDCY
jgi:hypothetical protein